MKPPTQHKRPAAAPPPEMLAEPDLLIAAARSADGASWLVTATRTGGTDSLRQTVTKDSRIGRGLEALFGQAR